MNKLKYLNVGCGGKFHAAWVNIDVFSQSPDVIEHDITKGLPFENNTFEVVYHSQVLEHFPKKEGEQLIRECYRVLKPGGIIRVVVPDLENITKEYIRLMELNISNPTDENKANYEWILLELFDQVARNKPGGEMAEYLGQQALTNKDYLFKRMGYNAMHTRNHALNNKTDEATAKFIRLKTFVKNCCKVNSGKHVLLKLFSKKEKNYYETGKFRYSGEVHYYMYDQFSMNELFSLVGFKEIKVKSPTESEIPGWGKYELDIKDNMVYDPTSLFVEARKLK